jgi:hypothetical protein
VPRAAQITSDEVTIYERRLLEVATSVSNDDLDFQRVCRRMLGAFPEEVERVFPTKLRNCASRAAQSEVPPPLGLRNPEPHPADYDWRFDLVTANAFAELAGKFTNVLCLGTPTVFNAIASKGRRACLIDRNPLLADVLKSSYLARVVISDVAAVDHIDGVFDAAVLDPPWYLADYELWLRKGLRLLTPAASIFLVLFRELTRPAAARERKQLLANLACLGSVSFPSFDAVYSTPRFEAEVLHRLGLPMLPAWRVGDVVRVDLAGSLPRCPFPDRVTAIRPTWTRFVAGEEVIFLAVDSDDTHPITHSPPEGGASFDLNSVSERDPRRRRINIWTSRNRAAIALGTRRIAAFLMTHAEPVVPGNVSSMSLSSEDYSAFRRLANDLQFSLRSLPDA